MNIYIKNLNGEATLEFERPYMIEDSVLEKVVRTLMPDLTFKNIAQLFWESDFINDCYKRLYFKDGEYPERDEITEYQAKNCSDEELAEIEAANRIRDFLFTYIPEDYSYDYILVDVSW